MQQTAITYALMVALEEQQQTSCLNQNEFQNTCFTSRYSPPVSRPIISS
ncbi:hypothetical protein EV14_3066 [Prochlorococcus sp. MIT 0703]|nr:hypothetical protein EV12_3101 [Prochlorococcus sp. MIT 0701]KGG30445.1 hypothetical protein EV14_3066 [Prochlorococcus sp. MIT 0703]